MPRLVYGIICHLSAEYVQDQYRLLYTPETRFIYHADRKAPLELVDLLHRMAMANPNVMIMTPQLCSWAGFSLTEVMLRILTAAAQLDDWDHLAFLSELHLPLQSREQIASGLALNHNYFEASVYRTFYEGGKADIHNRSAFVYRELPGVGAFATVENTPGEEFFDRLRHGSQWMTLCHATCKQLMNTGTGPDLKIFKNTILSDENAIQSWVGGLVNASVTNVRRIVTFVADPSRGGNNDMTFSEDLFFSARDKGYLFIRKRSRAVQPRIAAYFDEIFPEEKRPAKLEIKSFSPVFNEVLASESLVALLNTRAASVGFELMPLKRNANSPNLFCKVAHPGITAPYSIYLVSQDLFHFKVVAVMSASFKGYTDMMIGPYRTSVVRARLTYISFQREIHLADDHDFGFYTVQDVSKLDGLVSLIALYLGRISELSVNAADQP